MIIHKSCRQTCRRWLHTAPNIWQLKVSQQRRRTKLKSKTSFNIFLYVNIVSKNLRGVTLCTEQSSGTSYLPLCSTSALHSDMRYSTISTFPFMKAMNRVAHPSFILHAISLLSGRRSLSECSINIHCWYHDLSSNSDFNLIPVRNSLTRIAQESWGDPVNQESTRAKGAAGRTKVHIERQENERKLAESYVCPPTCIMLVHFFLSLCKEMVALDFCLIFSLDWKRSRYLLVPLRWTTIPDHNYKAPLYVTAPISHTPR